MKRKKKQDNSSLVEEQLAINELMSEKEKLQKENRELNKVLGEKRRASGIDYQACVIIEKEHFAKVDALKDEYVDIINLVDDKNEELSASNNNTSHLTKIVEDLKKEIPKLKEDKKKLEEEKQSILISLNTNKVNSEQYLTNIRESIDKKHREHRELSEELKVLRKEFAELSEKTKLENEVLAKRNRDLEIYEARLRRKYPNDKIILIN